MVRVRFQSDDKDARSAHVDIIDCDLSMVNALRRVILADVPYVSLLHEPYASDGSQFVFKSNTTVLHDHIMAHRMSMVPIRLSKMESQGYIPGSIRVRLRGENKGAVPLDLTTENIEVFLHDQPHPDSKRLYPADPMTKDWPLMSVLKPGEVLDIEATAISGVASKNAAFSVVSLCTFSPMLDDELVKKGRKAAEDSEDPVRALNRFEHIERKRCWIPDEDGHPKAFTLKIESECGMSARDILEIAVDVLEKKISGAKCTVSESDMAENAYSLEVKGEDHTLGNIMQSMAVDRLATDDGPLKFVGYFCTHPLEKRVVFKIVTRDSKLSPTEAFQSMKSVVLEQIQEFKKALHADSPQRDADGPKQAAAEPQQNVVGPQRDADEPNLEADEPKQAADEPNLEADEPQQAADEPNLEADEPKQAADEQRPDEASAV
jgi:DNA-directed RNA polymerase subunit L